MINFKTFKLTLLIIALFFTASCINNNSMKPTDFKNTEPSMTIEKYFEGPVKALGGPSQWSRLAIVLKLLAERSEDEPLSGLPSSRLMQWATLSACNAGATEEESQAKHRISN